MIVEIHASTDSELPKKLGKKIKEAGGRYSEARGYSDCRFVHLHIKNRDLIEQIVAEFPMYKRTTIVLRIGREAQVVYIKNGKPVFDTLPDEALRLFEREKCRYKEELTKDAELAGKGIADTRGKLGRAKIVLAAMNAFDTSGLNAFDLEFATDAKRNAEHEVVWLNEELNAKHAKLVELSKKLKSLESEPDYISELRKGL